MTALSYAALRRESTIPYYDRDFKQEILEPLLLEQRAREVLGVPEKASPGEIKRAYRKLAKAYHPDLGADDPSRHDKFVAIAESYDILTKRSSSTRRYSLHRKPIRLPRAVDEPEYFRWWLDRYGDFF